jgi:hypothetical protein
MLYTSSEPYRVTLNAIHIIRTLQSYSECYTHHQNPIELLRMLYTSSGSCSYSEHYARQNSSDPISFHSFRPMTLRRGKGQTASKRHHRCAICEASEYKKWDPRLLTALWAPTVCYKDAVLAFAVRKTRSGNNKLSFLTQPLQLYTWPPDVAIHLRCTGSNNVSVLAYTSLLASGSECPQKWITLQ